MGLLVDTSVWVALEHGQLTTSSISAVMHGEWVYTNPTILGELKTGVEVAGNPLLRQSRQAMLNRVLDYLVVDHTTQVAMQFGVINGFLRLTGKTRNRLQDLWIAASALEHDLTLLTRNGHDFLDIPNLKLVVV